MTDYNLIYYLCDKMQFNYWGLKAISMTTSNPIITKCEIGPFPKPMPEGMFDQMPSVRVTLSDGNTLSLFEYYPDEISFVESEFIGLTIEEAENLLFKKDVKFLQS
ncbi:MAG TPA: hypothetical protein PLV00_06160 [Caldisericia bacterium]|nr:hypothetical protein [Caldisericia bacterium]